MGEEIKNSEYWEERIANETWKTYNSAEEQNIELIKMYDKTSQSIKKEMYALAEIAEEEGGMTRTQQQRFQKLLGQQGHIYNEIEKLGVEVEKHATDQMLNSGKDVYGNIMTSLGDTDFAYPNKKEMKQMLRNPWHGSFFSDRLWRDTGELERNLNGIINDGVSTGKTVTEMAVQLSNAMNRAFNDAHRLVRTETINYMNRSALRGYKDAGVAKVQWWAAEDERTCDVCGSNHGKEYKIGKEPNLPCHPGCRCTWLPVLDSNETSTLGSGKSDKEKKVSPEEYVETIPDMKKVDIFIKKYENEIASYPVEHSYIIQSSGKVFHYVGDNKSVSFEGANLKDAIVLHNHPIIEGEISNCFQEDDFAFLQNFGTTIDRLRATYGTTRYEVSVTKDLSAVSYEAFKARASADVDIYSEFIDFGEYTYDLLAKEGYIKYAKTKVK